MIGVAIGVGLVAMALVVMGHSRLAGLVLLFFTVTLATARYFG